LVLVETEKVIGVEVLVTLTREDGVRFTEVPMDPLPDTLEGDTVRVGGAVASCTTEIEISELEQQVVIEPERVAPVLFGLMTTETVFVPICSPVGACIHDC
jgi:hypothetical protein